MTKSETLKSFDVEIDRWPDTKLLIEKSMDEYAKQTAIGFELWMIEKGIYRIKDTDMYESENGEHYAASPGQLYEYYQQTK